MLPQKPVLNQFQVAALYAIAACKANDLTRQLIQLPTSSDAAIRNFQASVSGQVGVKLCWTLTLRRRIGHP